MSTIRTLLVDDEFLALNLLEEFLRHVPDLEIVGKVKSPLKAVEILQQEQVDLIFLDIQMPTLAGHHLLKTLPQPPVVIFTTAYSDYAVEAFDLNAADYLLKPFSFERFLRAVNKAREQIRLRQGGRLAMASVSEPAPAPPASDFLAVKVDGKMVKVFLKDILFIEGLKEYVRLVCKTGRYVTLESLKNLEDQLPAGEFLRVHKSYIVARQHVQALSGNLLEIGEHRIPISRGKRDEVVEMVFGKGGN